MTARGPAPGRQSGGADSNVELIVGVVLGGLLCLSALVWTVGQIAALLHTGHQIPLTLTDALHSALAWPHHWTNPGLAFPERVRPALPAGWLIDGCALFVLACLGIVVRLGIRLWPGHRSSGSNTGFASRAEIRNLSGRRALPGTGTPGRRGGSRRGWRSGWRRPKPAGLYLGRELHTGQRLFGSTEDSYLDLGPPRSGKGIHLIIPQALATPGPVLLTATRSDSLRHTLALRSKHGPVMVFDPHRLAGDVPRLRWAPQHGCADPLVAITRARALAVGGQPADGSAASEPIFWHQMTEAVLRCYLHAAALAGLSMRDVLGWVGRPADPTPQQILRSTPGAAPGWAEELTAQINTDLKQRDSVWSGVRRSLDCLADPRVLDACSPPPEQAFDAITFLRSNGTLFLLGSTDAQLTVAPLITALVADLLDAARRLAAEAPDGRLHPALTVLLDEAANIAPIPSLPNLLADGGGSGITTICVLQSLAQARARWGEAGADAMWDAATTKIIFGGLGHADDLSDISRLIGDIDEITSTTTHGPGGTSTTHAVRRVPALPVEKLRCLPERHVIVLSRRTPPIHTVLTPWWRGPHVKQIRIALAGGQGLRTPDQAGEQVPADSQPQA